MRLALGAQPRPHHSATANRERGVVVAGGKPGPAPWPSEAATLILGLMPPYFGPLSVAGRALIREVLVFGLLATVATTLVFGLAPGLASGGG